MDRIKFEVIKKIADVNFKYKNLQDISHLDSNSPPSVFVGSGLKYPMVNVGILSPLEKDGNSWVYDDARYWAENNFEIKEVLKLRESLLNSRFQSKVKYSRLNRKFVQIAQEIAVASKPVDVEIELNNRLRLEKNKDKVMTPHGMNANLRKAKIVSNVRIDRKVDRIINDEIKASESIGILYRGNISEYAIQKILSVGVLGMKKSKKLVPTKWSITAVDDSIGKNILEKVRDYKWIEDYELFFGEFLGNCYLMFLLPSVWSYELFEMYLPGSSWNPSGEIKASTDFENYYGRKDYAFATAGGYYATRLSVLKYLEKIKRQAGVLVLRVETPSYWAALGVWVVRESVRKAMEKPAMKFSSISEILESGKKIGKLKFNFDSDGILRMSKLLKTIKTQKSLREWF